MNKIKFNKIARQTLVFFLALSIVSPALLAFPQKAEAVAQGDGRAVYGENTATTPRTRAWTGSWEDPESDLNIAAATIRHVIVKAAPTRDEMIVGIQTTTGVLYIQRWNGSSWSSEWDDTVSNTPLPSFDISYERSTGDAMVVYSGAVTTTNEIRYRIWNGSSWSAETNYDTVRTSATVQAIAMASVGGTSNDFAMAWVDSTLDLSANYWDGTNNVWKSEPSAALSTGVDSLAATAPLSTWSFDLDFEASGELLVVWGNAAGTDILYRTRAAGAAGAWSGANSTAAAFAEQSDDLELSADPNSDYMILVHTGSDSGADTEVGRWNGSAFPAAIDTSLPCSADTVCVIDISSDTTGAGTSGNAAGWLTDGANTFGIVTYDDTNAAGVDWVVYDKSADTWAAQTDCTTDCNSEPSSGDDKMHRIRQNPFNDAELFGLFVDTAADFSVKKLTLTGTTLTWSGTFGGVPLEATLSSIDGFAADFAFNRHIPAAVPTVTTQAESNVTENSATVNGNITATGGQNATVRGFAWGTNSALSNGDTATTTENGSFGTGAFTGSLSSLTCNTTYYSRPYATNPTGTGYGTIDSFTTSACTAPSVVTQGATDITFESATLNGNITAIGVGTNIIERGFAWGTSSALSGGDTATTSEIDIFGAGAFGISRTSLSCNTIYYFRAYAVNDSDYKGYGTIDSFTTSVCAVPTVTTQAESNVTQTSATVNGTITATNGSNATVRGFAWGTNSALSGGDTATTTENGSFGTGAFTGSLSSLTCNTLYYSRPYATNSTGTAYGSIDGFFTVVCNPTVTTQDPSSVTATSFTANGNITASSAVISARGFAWGTNSALSGGDTATTTETGSFSTGAFTGSISSLTCGTTYYTRAYGTNAGGTGHGSITSTTTTPCIPTVTTQAESNVTSSSVTVNGTITATGGANATVRGFAWGTNPTLSGGDTATTTENGSFGAGAFTGSLSSLTCGTTYYYRPYATNPTGTGYGTIISFTTSICSPTVTAQAASGIGLHSATLNGNITSTGGTNVMAYAKTRGFAYGTNSNLSGGDTATSTQRGVFNAGAFTGATSSLTWTAKASPWPTPDVGSDSAPAFADLDNDGDYDVLIGEFAGISHAYENTGSASSPTWTDKDAWNSPDAGSKAVPSFADLDNDGDWDLMVGTSTGASVAYQNTGSASSPTWSLQSSWNLPDVGANAAPAFADLDNDGDYDVLIGESAGISHAYENTGSASSPTWTDKNAWNSADVGDTAIPAFADLDDNGDLDLLIGKTQGATSAYENTGATALTGLTCSTTYYFRPYAVNTAGTSTSAITSFTTTACSAPTVTDFGAFSITATSATMNGQIDSTGGQNATVRGYAYGTSPTLATVIATTTENGSFGISSFQPNITNLTCNTTYYTRAYATNPVGTGYSSISSFMTTACAPTVTTQAVSSITATSSVLNGNITSTGGAHVKIRGFTWGTSATLSGGDTATSTARASGIGFKAGSFKGATSTVSWTAESAYDLPDIGAEAGPAFADLDNDGDYDALIGTSDGSATVYENTGSASAPTWSTRPAWNVPDSLRDNAKVSVADLDNDKDFDLMVGETDGPVDAYTNIGSVSSLSWQLQGSWGIFTDLGSNSAPTIGDLDNDGDYDLLAGTSTGASVAYQNSSLTFPTWGVADSAWNAPDVGDMATPVLVDLDYDGDLDLLIGESGGAVKGYENTGSVSSPTWSVKTAWDIAASGTNSAPAVADLDDDGDYDLSIGKFSGASSGFKNTGITALTGLVCETTYYARAYAVNSAGTSTGAIVSWTTSACDAPPDIQQLHYRWRNDDGSETAATWAAAEDSALTTEVFPGDRRRLRILLSNAGAGSAANYTYKLEHASSSCEVWQTVPAPSSLANEHWVMDPSQNIQDAFATTDSAGVTNPGGKTFAAGVIKAVGNTTSALNLTNSQFTELEYSIRSTGNVEVGTTYCFRLTNAGSTTNFTYTATPSIIVSAVVKRPQGGGGGNSGGGGESSSGGGTPQGGGSQGGGGGGGGEEGGGYTYPTPVGGGGSGGGGGDSGNALSSSYAIALEVLSETVLKTMDMLNRAFLRD